MSEIAGPPTVADLLREYGAAIRGSWAEIDGREVRNDMDNLAGWLDSGKVPDNARDTLGICVAGGGHWHEFCQEACGCPCAA